MDAPLTATFSLNSHLTIENEPIDDYVNPGDWFGKIWIVRIDCGYCPALVAVEAGNEGDAVDALIDSGKWNHLFVYNEEEDPEEYLNALESGSVGGNYCLPYDADKIHVYANPKLSVG